MKKVLMMLFLLCFLTGCTVVRINTKSIDNIVSVVLSKENTLYNTTGKGYKYYVPRGVVYIDSNGFKVFTKEGLIGYHNYCKSLKIEAPEIKESYTYPCHFKFYYGEWICLEDYIEKYKKLLFNSFKEEFLTEEEQDLAHNLV